MRVYACRNREGGTGSPLWNSFLFFPLMWRQGWCTHIQLCCFNKSMPHRQDFKGNFQAPSLPSPDGFEQGRREAGWKWRSQGISCGRHRCDNHQWHRNRSRAQAQAEGRALALLLSSSLLEGAMPLQQACQMGRWMLSRVGVGGNQVLLIWSLLMRLVSPVFGGAQFCRDQEGIPVPLHTGRGRFPAVLSQKMRYCLQSEAGFGAYN